MSHPHLRSWLTNATPPTSRRRTVIGFAATAVLPLTALLFAVAPAPGFADKPSPADIQATFAPTPAPPRIGLPVLGLDEGFAPSIQVQNTGDAPTVALLVFWSAAAACPPQASGPLKLECTGLLRPGSAWTLSGPFLPAGARSAIAYSLNAVDMAADRGGNLVRFSDLACSSLFNALVGNHEEWAKFDRAYQTRGVYEAPGMLGFGLDFEAHQGEPLAVRVDRDDPGTLGPDHTLRASYVGLDSSQLGAFDPVMGGYVYFLPWIRVNQDGASSRVHVQNMGPDCASVELWFRPASSTPVSPDNPDARCDDAVAAQVFTLAPGESRTIDATGVISAPLSSGLIRASGGPVAVVVDAFGPNQFASTTAQPAAASTARSGPLDDPNQTDGMLNSAPLVYRGYHGQLADVHGWDTRLFIQNASQVMSAKVELAFLDRGGDTLVTLIDWLCPYGSRVIDLRAVGGLPDNWVGSVRIESQDWWTPELAGLVPPELHTTVELARRATPDTEPEDLAAYTALTRHSGAGNLDAMRGAGPTAFSGSAVFALPGLVKGRTDGTPSTQLALVNLVEQPGYTDFAVFLFDQNGLLDVTCEKLAAGDVSFIDLMQWGILPPGFRGSAIISAVWWEHEVFSPTGMFMRNPVGLSAVMFNRVLAAEGGMASAISDAIEAIPIAEPYLPPRGVPCDIPPSVPSPTPTMASPTPFTPSATPRPPRWVVNLPWADTGRR
jgi:hypothetical protein